MLLTSAHPPQWSHSCPGQWRRRPSWGHRRTCQPGRPLWRSSCGWKSRQLWWDRGGGGVAFRRTGMCLVDSPAPIHQARRLQSAAVKCTAAGSNWAHFLKVRLRAETMCMDLLCCRPNLFIKSITKCDSLLFIIMFIIIAYHEMTYIYICIYYYYYWIIIELCISSIIIQ